MDYEATVFDKLRQITPGHPDYLRAQLMLAWADADQVTERYILRRLLEELGPEPTVTRVR